MHFDPKQLLSDSMDVYVVHEQLDGITHIVGVYTHNEAMIKSMGMENRTMTGPFRVRYNRSNFDQIQPQYRHRFDRGINS